MVRKPMFYPLCMFLLVFSLLVFFSSGSAQTLSPEEPAQQEMLYLPLIRVSEAAPVLPPPLQAKDCSGEHRFLTKDTYDNGVPIFEVGKKHLFSPSFIVNLNRQILDENFKIRTSGTGSKICLNKSIVSWIYKNPSLPYSPGDEIGVEVTKNRIDWQTLDVNPFLKADGSNPVGEFFTGIVPSAADEIAQVSKLGKSANLPKAGIFEATSATRLGRLVKFLGNAATIAIFVQRFFELQDMAVDKVDLITLPDGSHYLPRTRVSENTTIYLWWYRSGFEQTSQTFSIDQIIGLLFRNDVETSDKGWVLTRTPQARGVPMNIDEFFMLAPLLAERIVETVTDDELDQQLRDLLDEIDDIDRDPPAPPSDGGDGTCRPIGRDVLELAEWYHLGVQATRTKEFPTSSVAVSKAWLRSILKQSEVYTDYYEVKPPGTQMRRGQLLVISNTEGEFLIETRCIAVPSGLVHKFSAYGGCERSGGISGPGYCAADYIRLPNRGTGIITFP